ncbi:MAG: hypothetical protein HGA95_00750 [Caldiserica bacterium]|nr:hypothetical protein [Caldisericota bacterium]
MFTRFKAKKTGGVFLAQSGIRYPIIARELLRLYYPGRKPKATTTVELNKIKLGNNAIFQGFPAPAGIVRLNWNNEFIAIGKLVLSKGEIIPERLM